MPAPTVRLYWEDDSRLEADAIVVASRGQEVAFDRTCFYPGGGGQPPDRGWVMFADGQPREVTSARADEDGLIWHAAEPCASKPGATPISGDAARLRVDAARRLALARYHTVLHVLNTVALRDYGGWITGVQIAEDYSRIDFRLNQLTPALCRDLEAKVNAVVGENRKLEARFLPEAEFRDRPDLLRTLDVRPPVVGGKVRVVEIERFDAQACGGTHVHATGELGRFSIFQTENKGKNNKRMYVRLEAAGAGKKQ